MSTARRLVAALALVTLVTACAASDSASPSDGDRTSPSDGERTSPSQGSGDEGEPRTIEVRMSDDLRFDPDEITVSAGETVRFVVTNDGRTQHEFLIGDELTQARFEEEMGGGGIRHEMDAGVSVDPGQAETFEYEFAEAGVELLAACHEPGHYDAGMVATINVTE